MHALPWSGLTLTVILSVPTGDLAFTNGVWLISQVFGSLITHESRSPGASFPL